MLTNLLPKTKRGDEMLNNLLPNWQARIAADPGYLEWIQRDEEERIKALAAEDEARRYPYGRPEQDTGWYWEGRR